MAPVKYSHETCITQNKTAVNDSCDVVPLWNGDLCTTVQHLADHTACIPEPVLSECVEQHCHAIVSFQAEGIGKVINNSNVNEQNQLRFSQLS